FFRGRCQARPYSCEWGKRADSSLVMIGGSRRLAGKGCSWGGLRMSIRRLTLLACLALTFGTVAGGAAQDGAAPAAALVGGTCAAPGDTVTALRDLSVRDGGEVLVSLTTIDVALADLLGADHAIVLTDGGTVVACGDLAGAADDVYIGVAARADGGWGGV